MKHQFESLLMKEGIRYESNVDLRNKTWIHRGGMADFFVVPESVYALRLVMSFLYSHSIRHLLIGSTSNIYILNTTNIPVVVSTLRCNRFCVKENYVECDCGVQVSKLAWQMIENGISGFEYLTKLPGTIGAAIYNNSSVKTPDNSVTRLLIDLDILTVNGIKTIRAEDLHFSYRSSDLKKQVLQGTILQARLRKEVGDIEEMTIIAQNNEAERYLLLDGPAQNLGCTVHQEFCNGPMPLKYRIPVFLFSMINSVLFKDEFIRKKRFKRFILSISGHKKLIPYVSDKIMITFIWKDNNADRYFEEYLRFMREVYRTDRIEIEII